MPGQKPTFAIFLSAIVGGKKTGKPVTVQMLNDALNFVENAGARDLRKNLYQYIDGSHVPRADRAWNIGEALRLLELSWCNGMIALFFAGHYFDFIGTFGKIDRDVLVQYRMLAGSLITNLSGSWIILGKERLRVYERLSRIPISDDADADWRGLCGASLDDDAFAKLTIGFNEAWQAWCTEQTIVHHDLYLLARATINAAIPLWELQKHISDGLNRWLRRIAYANPSDMRF